MSDVGLTIGKVTVVTTSNGGRPPEFFATRIVDRLMYVADNAPPPIREQAHAFRAEMLAIVLAGVNQAIESDRIYRK